MSGIEIGDRVAITDDDSLVYGQVGVVGDKTGSWLTVHLDGGGHVGVFVWQVERKEKEADHGD